MPLCSLFLEEQIYSDMWELCWSLTGLHQMKSPSLKIKLEKEQQAVSSVMSWLKIWHKRMSIWDDLFWFDRTHLPGSLPSIWVEPPVPLPSTFLGQGENPSDEYFMQLLGACSLLSFCFGSLPQVCWQRSMKTYLLYHQGWPSKSHWACTDLL